jgi:hypothetical protein
LFAGLRDPRSPVFFCHTLCEEDEAAHFFSNQIRDLNFSHCAKSVFKTANKPLVMVMFAQKLTFWLATLILTLLLPLWGALLMGNIDVTHYLLNIADIIDKP